MLRAYFARLSTSALILLLCGFLPVLGLTGCARPIAFGVILWPEEESELVGGQVVALYAESEIYDHYEIDQEATTIERWRVNRFDRREQAEQFAETFAPFGQIYGQADRTALPVRTENDRSSNLIYRLRKGEIVKVLERDEEQADEAGFRGYWYRVLTLSGAQGWTFGYYLTVFDVTEGQPVIAVDTDEQIHKFLTTVWRPAHFRTMIDSEKIDLRLFQIGYGLFPSPLEKRIALQLPDTEIEFRYERLTSIGDNRLLAEGETPLTIQLITDDKIGIHYMVGVETIEQELYRIDADIATIANRERARREANYADLLSRGSRLVSREWGVLEPLLGRRFRWTGYERLIGDIVPEDAGALGRVGIELAFADEFAGRYDGTVTLYFDSQPLVPIHLLYSFRSAGIELQPIVPSDLEMDFIVVSISQDQILAFNYR